MNQIATGNVLKYCCILLFMALPVFGKAQLFRVAFNITDRESNALIYATIRINNSDTTADANGQQRFQLGGGHYKISVSAVGYHQLDTILNLVKDTTIHLILTNRETMLGNVLVTAGKQLYKTQMSAQSLTIAELRKLPVILGEIDPMKTITLLPGIKNGGEASAGVYVRGGGPDQNLVLLDGIPVYNPNHLLGFFSVFNGEAIKGVEVIKGGMPAEYGGRLSSVIAIDTRSGHKDSTKISGGIGLIASRLAIEGPVVKGKISYMFSGRRTYLDQVGKLVARDKIGSNGYYFYDFNGKIDYTINNNNSLTATLYGGEDKFTYADIAPEGERMFNANWGNRIAGLTWKQQITTKLKQQVSLIYNDFRLDSRLGFSTSNYIFSSGLKDYQIKNDWQYNLHTWLKFKAGLQYIRHQFKPGAGEVNVAEQDFIPQINPQFAREAATYVSAETQVTDALQIVAGLRYSYFNQTGPTTQVLYEKDGTPTGEARIYKKGESIAKYHHPEPRLNLLYRLTGNSSLKASYTRTVQYLHLATTSAATFPSDLWIPASRIVKPGQAWQTAAGYYQSIFNNRVELSVEAYYKEMTHQIEFKPGAQLLLNQNLEGEMVFGKGKAYGVELMLQKKQGRLTGWIGYTLSRAERTFPDLNEGKPFAYRYDRTHDVSIVTNYRINKHWEASGVFVFGTGNALTLPTGRFTYNTGYNRGIHHFIFTTVDQYNKINDFRMPSYHRLDLAFIYTRRPEKVKGFRSSWNFSIYNVYNRSNPYFIYLDARRMEREVNAKMVYLFPVLPSVTWNFKLD